MYHGQARLLLCAGYVSHCNDELLRQCYFICWDGRTVFFVFVQQGVLLAPVYVGVVQKMLMTPSLSVAMSDELRKHQAAAR
jgi:hypothetical protein